MKKCFLLFLLPLLYSHALFAQCQETDRERVMLIGDSWAQFMLTDNTITPVLEKWGHSGFTCYSNSNISVNGLRTRDLLDPVRQAEIQNQLNLRPDIDFVHVSIGGNDVLYSWDVSFTPYQTDSLLDAVYYRLDSIFDFLKSARPGIRILWSGYAYPNFGEVIGELGTLASTHPFYNLWQDMGFPTFQQLNGILNTYSSFIDSLAALDPQVDFVRANGLMQYVYGQNTPLAVPPGTSYPPFAAPLPDGYPDFPSPKTTMRNYFLFTDCFHLSPAGYKTFIDYHTQKFYHKQLMADNYLLSEGGTMDGTVFATGSVSNQIQLGKNGPDDASSVLSFNTTTLPDTGISSASIFLRRESLSGTNPYGNSLQVRIAGGYFGASANIEAADFVSPGDASGSPCRFGSDVDNGHWIRLDLPASLLPYITNNTATQFVISASGAGGLVTFSGASDPDFAPVLNLKYGPSQTTAINEDRGGQKLMLYPNPTSGKVLIAGLKDKVSSIEVWSTTGNMLMRSSGETTTADLQDLPSGLYLIRVMTTKGLRTGYVVKQ